MAIITHFLVNMLAEWNSNLDPCLYVISLTENPWKISNMSRNAECFSTGMCWSDLRSCRLMVDINRYFRNALCPNMFRAHIPRKNSSWRIWRNWNLVSECMDHSQQSVYHKLHGLVNLKSKQCWSIGFVTVFCNPFSLLAVIKNILTHNKDFPFDVQPVPLR